MRGATNMSIDMVLNVTWQAFAEVPVTALYRALMLRQSVFVVEQDCAYLDADGLDELAIHGLGRDQDGCLSAQWHESCHPVANSCCRRSAGSQWWPLRVAPVTVARSSRPRLPRSNGAILVPRCASMRRLIFEPFYGSFGFRRTGVPFDEDRIPHVAMIREPAA